MMTQKDLPPDVKSGLDVADRVLEKVEDISFCQPDQSVMLCSHPLVQKIVQAYDDYENKAAAKHKEKEHGGLETRNDRRWRRRND